jgi:hypothetical protein
VPELGTETPRPGRIFLAFLSFNLFCIGFAGLFGAVATTAYVLYSGVPDGLGVFEAVRTLSMSSSLARLLLLLPFLIGAALGCYLWAHTMKRTRFISPETIRRFTGPL